MKNIYTTLAILFFSILLYTCKKEEVPQTCSDGIMNQNELDVDCGGVCDECPSIIGVWKATVFTLNGNDLFSTFEIDELFYEFHANFSLSIFAVYQDQETELSEGSYSTDSDSLSLVVNSNLSKYKYDVTTSELQIEGIEPNGSLAKIILQRVTTDLCQGVPCDNGTCYYGYCICQDGWIGNDCSNLDLPSQIKVTTLEFYGNSVTYSNNSLNDYDINPTANSTVAKPDPYLVFRNSSGIEVGRTNTLINNECTSVNPCSYNLNIIFNINDIYTIEVWNDDIIDGEVVDENSNYLMELDWTTLLNEAIDSPTQVTGFNNNDFFFKLVAEWANQNDWTFPEITLTNFEFLN